MPAQAETLTAAPLRTAVVNASAQLRESIAGAETAALSAIDQAQSAWADARGGIAAAYLFSGDALGALDHAGRATVDGVTEIGSVAAQHGRAALADAIEVGQKSFQATCFGELVDLHSSYIARRANAYFLAIADINALAQDRTRAAWMPFGEVLSGKGQCAAAAESPAKPRKARAV